MILVEYLPGKRNVEHLIGALFPWKRDDPVDEVARDGEFGRHRRHAAKLAQLPKSALLHELRHCLSRYETFQIAEVVAVIFAELLVNRAKLFLEIELTLVLEQRSANVFLDFSLEPQNLDLGSDELRQRQLVPALEVQVSLGTASGQTLSRAAEAVRELLREVLRTYLTP